MDPWTKVQLFDPALANFLTQTFDSEELSKALLTEPAVIEDIFHTWTLSATLTRDLGRGLVFLQKNKASNKAKKYRNAVLASAQNRISAGEAIARLLPEMILFENPKLEEEFHILFELLTQKATISSAVSVMSFVIVLLQDHGVSATLNYLELLSTCCQQLTDYEQFQQITVLLPDALQSISPRKREIHLELLTKFHKQTPQYLSAALKGISNGLRLLNEDSLQLFYARARIKINENREKGLRFLALESSSGRDCGESLRSAIVLSEIKSASIRYLEARLGIHLTIEPLPPPATRPLHTTEQSKAHTTIRITSNGKAFFLPEEIDHYQSKGGNLDLAKGLLRLEASLYEWHSFDFDLEKLIDTLPLYPMPPLLRNQFIAGINELKREDKRESDFSRFFSFFPSPDLARIIFTLCEHRRLTKAMARHYPGMAWKTRTLLQDEIKRQTYTRRYISFITYLYYLLVVEETLPAFLESLIEVEQSTCAALVQLEIDKHSLLGDVEDSAALTIALFPLIYKKQPEVGIDEIPFARIFDERPYLANHQASEATVATLKSLLAEQECKLYASELRPVVEPATGAVSMDKLKALLAQKGTGKPDASSSVLLTSLERNLPLQSVPDIAQPEGNRLRYREWNHLTHEFIPNHVTVIERQPILDRKEYYHEVLAEYHFQVAAIRNTFERMKPEKISIERRTIEGDELDYPALIDHHLDKRCGTTPSERIYLRKNKNEREVAVLLLVDFSRSTVTAVNNSTKRVIDLEKEAIVLFCEGLDVVGDAFSIAGFSGLGRNNVEYLKIKDFAEPLSNTVRQRIATIEPMRNTRTGAAIRHASHHLGAIPAKVRILLLLGDGFPNDVDYRREYAVEDTQQAILEAMAKNIITRSITVNISDISGLDKVYGRFRNNVISNIHELPTRLAAIYGALTR